MITARFISENYLKGETAISGNVDVKDLVPFVDQTQDIDVQPIIGTKLYNTLMAAIVSNTVTVDLAALLNVIRPYHAYMTLWRAIPFLQAKVRNKSILSGEAEAAKTVGHEDIKWLRNETKGVAEFYAKRLQEYLCDNKALYPDYTSPDDPMSPNGTIGYDCDLAMDPEDVCSCGDRACYCGCNSCY